MGSFAVWGTSRADLDRLAWSVAAAIDPGFLWIEMTEGSAPPSARELEVLEEIDLDRIERMDRAELLLPALGPQHGGHGRSPGDLELPYRLLERIERRSKTTPATALVLSNLDRTLALVSDDSRLLDSIVGGTRSRRLSLIATFGTETSPALDPFECLVHVSPGPDGNLWNPTVDWTSREPASTPAVVPPPARVTHREAVRHFRAQRRTGL